MILTISTLIAVLSLTEALPLTNDVEGYQNHLQNADHLKTRPSNQPGLLDIADAYLKSIPKDKFKKPNEDIVEYVVRTINEFSKVPSLINNVTNAIKNYKHNDEKVDETGQESDNHKKPSTRRKLIEKASDSDKDAGLNNLLQPPVLFFGEIVGRMMETAKTVVDALQNFKQDNKTLDENNQKSDNDPDPPTRRNIFVDMAMGAAKNALLNNFIPQPQTSNPNGGLFGTMIDAAKNLIFIPQNILGGVLNRRSNSDDEDLEISPSVNDNYNVPDNLRPEKRFLLTKILTGYVDKFARVGENKNNQGNTMNRGWFNRRTLGEQDTLKNTKQIKELFDLLFDVKPKPVDLEIVYNGDSTTQDKNPRKIKVIVDLKPKDNANRRSIGKEAPTNTPEKKYMQETSRIIEKVKEGISEFAKNATEVINKISQFPFNKVVNYVMDTVRQTVNSPNRRNIEQEASDSKVLSSLFEGILQFLKNRPEAITTANKHVERRKFENNEGLNIYPTKTNHEKPQQNSLEFYKDFHELTEDFPGITESATIPNNFYEIDENDFSIKPLKTYNEQQKIKLNPADYYKGYYIGTKKIPEIGETLAMPDNFYEMIKPEEDEGLDIKPSNTLIRQHKQKRSQPQYQKHTVFQNLLNSFANPLNRDQHRQKKHNKRDITSYHLRGSRDSVPTVKRSVDFMPNKPRSSEINDSTMDDCYGVPLSICESKREKAMDSEFGISSNSNNQDLEETSFGQPNLANRRFISGIINGIGGVVNKINPFAKKDVSTATHKPVNNMQLFSNDPCHGKPPSLCKPGMKNNMVQPMAGNGYQPLPGNIYQKQAGNSYQQPPGYQPQTPGYQPQSPGYQPQPPGYQPQSPGYQPQSPGYQPQQHGYQPQPQGPFNHQQSPPARNPQQNMNPLNNRVQTAVNGQQMQLQGGFYNQQAPQVNYQQQPPQTNNYG